MRSLPELMNSDDGRALLETKGVFTSDAAFVDNLIPPARSGLVEIAALHPSRFPIYAAHQVKSDYPASVVSKIRAARDLQATHPKVAVALLWLDMDRAGSDKSTASIALRGRGGAVQVRLASRKHDDREVRFVTVDPANLEEASRKLGAWARQHGAATAARWERVASALEERAPATLAEANLALTTFLVRDHFGLDSPSILVSDLAGELADPVNEVVERIDDVVTVFNSAIDALAAADVDPRVHHLRPDYLPLHYSCDRDGRRCSLSREQRGNDTFAVTTCVCGAEYRFNLGVGSIEELAATGRWSPDVTLPIYLNDLASGVVAGQSSALYGLVLNEVVEKVLARRPIPMLIPDDLTEVLARGAGEPGLLQDYLAGT